MNPLIALLIETKLSLFDLRIRHKCLCACVVGLIGCEKNGLYNNKLCFSIKLSKIFSSFVDCFFSWSIPSSYISSSHGFVPLTLSESMQPPQPYITDKRFAQMTAKWDKLVWRFLRRRH